MNTPATNLRHELPADADSPAPVESEGKQSFESYSDYYRSTKKGQWAKALFACYGIHVAATIVVATVLVLAVPNGEAVAYLTIGYMLIGWLPLTRLYPILKRKLG